VPYSEQNRDLLDRTRLARMKSGALLVNASRGGLVDEEALADALRSGALGGAALDVFEHEPYTGPLLGIPNVLTTAHMGSYAQESRQMMEHEAAVNVAQGLVQLGLMHSTHA
jgi:D-3-phosphoglycerate dehydrogenase